MSKNFVIRPIQNDHEYRLALARIDELWDAKNKTPEAATCEVLCLLVEDYEKKHFEFGENFDPVDLILFWMEQNSLTRKDLEKHIGPRGRVAEILNRKRSLTLTMIRNLTAAGLPAELLVKENKTTKVTSKAPGVARKGKRSRSLPSITRNHLQARANG